MGWYNKLFGPKETWRLVKTIKYEHGIVRGKGTSQEEEGTMFYHLFESNLGGRKVLPKCTFRDADADKLNAYAVSTEYYQTHLYRWLVGRADPEIPRFDEVEQEEVMHYLRGAIDEPI